MLTIYKASAGSGKTYTLAKEYIRNLLGYRPSPTAQYRLRPKGQHAHRKILAVTFSVKATEEMKRRIIDELALLADPTAKSDYRSDFINEFRCSAEQLAETANEALHEVLFDFGLFNVSTIDAFFQTVLRQFSREIDLQGNYEVDLDDYNAIAAGVGEMFDSINYYNTPRSRQLEQWIIRLMEQKVSDGNSHNLLNRSSSFYNDLIKALQKFMGETFRINSESICRYFTDDPERIGRFQTSIAQRYNSLTNTLFAQAKDLYGELRKRGMDSTDVINKDVLSFIANLADRRIEYLISNPLKTVQSAVDDHKKRYKAAWLKKNEPSEPIDPMIAKLCSDAMSIRDELCTLNALTSNIYALGLLGFVLEFLTRYREENNLILLSDTNELLRRIIRDDMTPFIYEKLGYFLDHFLIDEFQDTSQLQWANMMPLLLESISRGADNLIIGDEKQCIYRFRNSDPDLLSQQAQSQITTHIADSVTLRGIEISDNTNWRSSRDIVVFNNSLFTAIAQDLQVTDTYANTIQQVSSKHSDHAGYIDVEIRGGKDADREELDTYALTRMADNIKRQLESGYRPTDIAILVRKNREGEMAIDYLLSLMDDPESGFPRVALTSRESVRVSSSPVVKLIVSALRLVATPDSTADDRKQSELKLAQLINRFEYYFNQLDVEASIAITKALEEDSGEDIDRLTRDSVTMECVTLPSMVERIIGTFLSPAQRERHNIFISAFQDIVLDYCAKGQSDVYSFLEWWDTTGKQQSIATPEGLDAISVITIHASKGLQYHCVHVPFANWNMYSPSTAYHPSYDWYTIPPIKGIDPSDMPPLMPLENKKGLELTAFAPQYEIVKARQRVDNLNILYVAFTRAVDELIVTSSISSHNANDSIPAALISALNSHRDLGTQFTTDLSSYTVDNHLIIGSPTTPQPDDQKLSDTKPMPPYTTVERHAAWEMTRIDDLCDIERARGRGIFLHDVMSEVRRKTDLDLALRRRAYRVGMPQSELRRYAAELTRALDDPRVARWFDPTCRIVNERTISLPDGEHYRPDRIVWTDSAIEIIDYKFGQQHKGRYSRQVGKYMSYLSKMYPDTPIRGFLWYPDEGVITEVKATLEL